MLNPKLVWNTDESMKQISYYNDEQEEIKWVDYLGNEYISTDKYGCCLLPTTFDLKLSKSYANFLEYIENNDPNVLNDTPECLR